MGVKLFQFQEHFELLTFNSLFKLSKALKKKKVTNDMIHQVKRHIVVFMLVPGLTVVSIQV